MDFGMFSIFREKIQKDYVSAPVVIFFYNRPEILKQTLISVINLKPSRIYLISDGPKDDNKSDIELCNLCKSYAELLVPRNIEIIKHYSPVNLGCGIRMATGIQWIFQQEKMAILLEDDCIPSRSFVNFCDYMLLAYESNENVGCISGSNYQNGINRSNWYGYYYSKFPAVWGWAAWRRSITGYDMDLKSLSIEQCHILIEKNLPDPWSIKTWKSYLSKALNRKDVWDLQFVMHCWIKNMLAIIPNKNLVTNIGYGELATHTKKKTIWMDMKVHELNSIRLRNSKPKADKLADAYYLDFHMGRAKSAPKFRGKI